MSLGITANKKRNGALLAYIAKNIQGINLRKLLKIVYLIDEKFMELRGFPLTWFDYYAWAKGPVAPEVYDVKNGAFSEYVTCHKNEEGKNIIDSVLEHKYHVLKQMDVFSTYEMGVIDEIMYKYEHCTADELSELTHAETSLWSQIVKENQIQFVEGKSTVLIPLQMMNEGNEEKEETYEDAKWNMEFQAALNQCKN
jgi:uncharacterized phage-associated protein